MLYIPNNVAVKESYAPTRNIVKPRDIVENLAGEVLSQLAVATGFSTRILARCEQRIVGKDHRCKIMILFKHCFPMFPILYEGERTIIAVRSRMADPFRFFRRYFNLILCYYA